MPAKSLQPNKIHSWVLGIRTWISFGAIIQLPISGLFHKRRFIILSIYLKIIENIINKFPAKCSKVECCCLVTKSCPTLCEPWTEHARLLCPPLSPQVYSVSCPLSHLCDLTISSSAAPYPFAFTLSQPQGLFQ